MFQFETCAVILRRHRRRFAVFTMQPPGFKG
jgi:hypothetical protein